MIARCACGRPPDGDPARKPAVPGSPRQQLLVQLLARDGERLRNQARHHAPSVVDAEDAIQDACIVFLRHFTASPQAALPWMMVVVRHCAWKIAARRRGREAPIAPNPTDAFDPSGQLFALLDERPGPAEQLEGEELAERIELLEALKPDERTALVLFALGYSYRRSPPARAGLSPRSTDVSAKAAPPCVG